MKATLLEMLLMSWVAGLCCWLGALASKLENFREQKLKQDLIHGIVALGGGILLAAVAFALAPAGMNHLSISTLTILFVSGGLTFCIIDAQLARRGTERAQLLAMLMDFLPEAASLGAVFCHDRSLGVLLALFIGLQNLPEGFNAFREVTSSGMTSRKALVSFFRLSFLGPTAALAGYLFLQQAPKLSAGIMSFAAGGILYLIFQDIAPQSKIKRHVSPALGAVIGFTIGMLLKELLP